MDVYVLLMEVRVHRIAYGVVSVHVVAPGGDGVAQSSQVEIPIELGDFDVVTSQGEPVDAVVHVILFDEAEHEVALAGRTATALSVGVHLDS